MSFDDYVNHITQKIKLATAIAVIRSKPENLSTIEYIEKLRETFDSMECDSDVTVCSDDFDVEYDDVIDNAPDIDVIDDFEPITSSIIDYNHNDNIKDTGNVNAAQKDIRNDQVIYNHIDKGIRTDNVIGPNVDSEVRSNNVQHKVSGDNTFVDTLQELKEVDNLALDKPKCPILENSQIREDIEDVDSDATECETNPQIILNNTLEETEIYSISDFTPFYTHYSESQVQNIAIEPKLMYKNQNEAKVSKNLIEIPQKGQNCESLNERLLNECNTKENNTINLEVNVTFSQNAQNSESLSDFNMKEQNIFGNTDNVSKNNTNYANVSNFYANDSNIDKHSTHDKDLNFYANDANIRDTNMNSAEIIDNHNIKQNHKISEIANNENVNHSNADNVANDKLTIIDSKITETITQNLANDIDIQSNESDDMTDSQREVIPFKVIEELNKIKNYMKKRNDRRISVDGSSDSGYRSDSQGRSSRNSIQLSTTSINQSAHSLLTYIICCSLTKNTHEITKEVSKTLGSLVDKLHEDEIYPLFLEVLLDTITELLRSIYEDESSNLLLTKDEKVQRVLLLNKSTHIQKYTIDKITNILQTIDTEANEVNHTAKMENLCYIFHILEIILSKYKIDDNSQSQNSQEKVLKRSSITDIWRKKWNLSKEVVVENVEKKCPLTKCSEVLNKMIVNCMEGYSLISFVALKCFNLLQP